MVDPFVVVILFTTNFLIFSTSLPNEKRPDKFDEQEVDAVVNGILMGQSTQRSVEMTNELSEPLRIDCGSEEDDLGTLTIKPGHRVVWSFAVNEETWYECELWANGGRHKIFEMFPGPRKMGMKKRRLHWIIRLGGIYEGEMHSEKDESGNWVLQKPRRWHHWKSV